MANIELPLPGVRNKRVLQAMQHVPRDQFVPEQWRHQAFGDHPLPIGHGQTISQPLIVAEMTAAIRPLPHHRILDVGTGSGYQAAVLSELVSKVYSIEILQPLAREARDRLAELGYDNVEVRCGDGSRGWPEQAPFDGIVCAAAPTRIPPALIEQLAPGGRLVIPAGRIHQKLWLIEKDARGEVKQFSIASVAFVPMTGEAQNDDRPA